MRWLQASASAMRLAAASPARCLIRPSLAAPRTTSREPYSLGRMATVTTAGFRFPNPTGDQANNFHGRVLPTGLGPDESALIRENFLGSPGGGVRRHADVEVEFKHVLAHPAGSERGAVPSSEKAPQISVGGHQKLIFVGNHWASHSDHAAGQRRQAGLPKTIMTATAATTTETKGQGLGSWRFGFEGEPRRP